MAYIHTKPAHFKLKALFLLSIMCATLIKACTIGQPFQWREFEHCAAQFDSFLDLDQFWEALTASFHVFCIPISSCFSLLRSSIAIFFFANIWPPNFFWFALAIVVSPSPIRVQFTTVGRTVESIFEQKIPPIYWEVFCLLKFSKWIFFSQKMISKYFIIYSIFVDVETGYVQNPIQKLSSFFCGCHAIPTYEIWS